MTADRTVFWLGALLFFVLLRIALSFFYEKQMGVHRVSLVERLRRGCDAFFYQAN